MRSCLSSAAPRLARAAFVNIILLGFALGAPAAIAQEIVVSVNGDPITSVDIEQRMKMLRAIHKPATKDAAIESMIADRLKAHEGARFGIVIKDDEIGEQVQSDAKKMKIQPQALLTAMTSAGVSQEHLRNHFKAELAYVVLTKALNKGVEASEVAVRQELAKEKGKVGVTTYTIRQVVFTLEPGDGPPAIEAAAKQAAALRAKFTSCDTGIPYAKTLPGVAVRDVVTRSSTQLGDGIKDVLDKTPIGHLTAPSRSGNGIEVIAVCERGAARNDDDLRKEISDRILAEHLEQDLTAKYKEMRAHAVIARPHG